MHLKSYLGGYGVVTTHGYGVAPLMEALYSGIYNPVETSSSKAFYIDDRSNASVKFHLVNRLLAAWKESGGENKVGEFFKNGCVILASTKGIIEDYIWSASPVDLSRDPFTEILLEFFKQSGLMPSQYFTVSNACASSHSAIFLANGFLSTGQFTDVLVLATDWIGPFVQRGFQSLQAITNSKPRPFDQDRDGLLLGEAAVALFLTSKPQKISVAGISIDCEGFAVTRPQDSGASLQLAVEMALSGLRPDFIVAHGTATPANDAVEDRVFVKFFGLPTPPVTCNKWSVGHTLGASGLIDTIVAAEILQRGKIFPIATSQIISQEFGSDIVLSLREDKYSSALISSLGFGGIHSAAFLEIVNK